MSLVDIQVDIQYVPKPDTVATFGCETRDQLALWRPEICGVCCLKMIGDTKHRTTEVSLWQLTEACIQQGAFRVESTGRVEGIFYRPMLKVAKSFGLRGLVLPRLPLAVVRLFLVLRVAPILSIELHELDPKYNAGHLVVVVGYETKDKAYIVHDPSSVVAKSGKLAHISSAMLQRISNNRGVVLF